MDVEYDSMFSEREHPYPRAMTFKVLSNSEWKTYADVIERSIPNKTVFERIREYIGM